MSNHNDSRLNMPMMGELNAFRKPGTTRRFDRNADSRYLIQEVVTDRYIYDAIGKGPYKGVVLRVEEPFTAQSYDHPEQNPEGYLMSGSVASSATNLLRLRIRVPEVHASLPIPKCLPQQSTIQSGFDPEDRIINLYPIFVAENAGLNKTNPLPGQMVWVDFRDKANFEKPIYKGLVDRAVTLMMPCADNPQNNFNSARNCAGLTTGAPGSAAFGAHCRKLISGSIAQLYGEPQHDHNGIIVDEASQLPTILTPEECRTVQGPTPSSPTTTMPTGPVSTVQEQTCEAWLAARRSRLAGLTRSGYVGADHKYYKILLPGIPCVSAGQTLVGSGIDAAGLERAVLAEMALWHPDSIFPTWAGQPGDGFKHHRECDSVGKLRVSAYWRNLHRDLPGHLDQPCGSVPWSAVYISYIMDHGGDPGNWDFGEPQGFGRCKNAVIHPGGRTVNCHIDSNGYKTHYGYSMIAKKGNVIHNDATRAQSQDIAYDPAVRRSKYSNTNLDGVNGWTAWLTTPTNASPSGTGPGNIMAQVGDILVRARGGAGAGRNTNTHGDVVWKIGGGVAWLSGGNIGAHRTRGGSQTALCTQYLDLDANGFYKTFDSKQSNNKAYKGDTYELILKKNGELIETGGTPATTGGP